MLTYIVTQQQPHSPVGSDSREKRVCMSLVSCGRRNINSFELLDLEPSPRHMLLFTACKLSKRGKPEEMSTRGAGSGMATALSCIHLASGTVLWTILRMLRVQPGLTTLSHVLPQFLKAGSYSCICTCKALISSAGLKAAL